MKKREKNKRKTFSLFVVFSIFYFIFLTQGVFCPAFSSHDDKNLKLSLPLPPPRRKGDISLEEAISCRISRREYKNVPLSLEEISQLLWAAAGLREGVDSVTSATRTAPSAGACYPVETYLIAGNIPELLPGVYHYNWQEHTLTLLFSGDKREELAEAALGQKMVREAPASIVFTAYFPRTTRRYGERGLRYVFIDVGCMIQNVYLQAETISCATVSVGAFYDNKVKEILGKKNEEPLCIMPIGKR